MKVTVSQPVRNLLDHAGQDYALAVEFIAKNRELEVKSFTTNEELSNEQLHAIRGKIAALNLCLDILGWEEAKGKLG